MIFKNIILFFVFLLFALPARAELNMYDFDRAHTRIMFEVDHGGLSKVIGEFRDYDGYFMFDKENPEESYVTITIDPKSVDTGHEGLNKVLQNKHFFNSALHDKISFRSTKIVKISENVGKVTGNLSMLGNVKRLTLDVVFNKEREFFGQTKAGFSLESKLKRSDFGMIYGYPDVGDEVEIKIQVEGVRRDLK